MKRSLLILTGALALIVCWQGHSSGQVPDSPPSFVVGPDGVARRADPPRFPDFNTVTRGAKEYEGLFKLYQKDENLYMEIQPHQLNRPILCPIAVARGAGMGGQTLNMDEQWVLLFKRVNDKIQVIRRNVHFKAKSGSPVARAVETSYSDSVLMALRIVTVNPMKQSAPLINLNDIFMTDFAQLGLGGFDSSRSSWFKVKTFPRNLELQVEATYSGRRMFGDESTIDQRGHTVVIHYGLAEFPDGSYTPRLADDRVGHFVSAVKDYTSDSKDTTFVRYVNRWRLERAEPVDSKNPNRLSVPKKSIKFYIEKTVPHEYRAAVQEGILEWNKAFEKIGYRNAIEVVQQRDDEDFDPEDMNYNTFRWITTDSAFAMGPLRANPLTGEILDADIIFDADMIRVWKRDRQVFNSHGAALEPASPIQAADEGWGIDQRLLQRHAAAAGWNDTPERANEDPRLAQFWGIRNGACQCGGHMKYEMGMASMALLGRGWIKPGERLPDELVQQAVKMVVMHEVGHTLGLRHNFKGSTMLPNEQLNDTKITHEKGLIGSVMDYTPVNIAPKGVKQGDYYTTTLGPYDYWAIEYAYKPLSGGTEGEVAELQKIAAKGALPGHDYGTDEDTFLTSDPHTNRWDLGADPMKFSQDRMLLAEELLQGLANHVVDEGDGYQRARVAFGVLLAQYGDGAYLISRYIGAEHTYRDHRGDPQGRDPQTPVSAAKQREALRFLQQHVFNDKTFQFPPELLRHLAVERWSHWGADSDSTDYPVYEKILAIQRVALSRLLSPVVLRRLQNNALKAGVDDKPLTVAEVLRGTTDGIWIDLPNGGPKLDKRTIPSSIVRRNLQREHVKQLSDLVLGRKGEAAPPDARSLARMHLREITKRVDATLADDQATVDETTRAHLEECRERIAKALSASMQVTD